MITPLRFFPAQKDGGRSFLQNFKSLRFSSRYINALNFVAPQAKKFDKNNQGMFFLVKLID